MKKKINIIVVEDEESQIDTLYMFLKIYMPEYIFEIFKNSKKALTKFRKDKYSLAIVDLLLKGSETQGSGLIREMRKRDPLIDIIVVTGTEYQALPLGTKYKDLNIRKWIKKPIKASELEITIRQIIEKSS
jgi:DNA-binding NtrC family response regulator